MLMLQRAATTVAPEECKDAAVVMACALDPESDACPAACRKTTKDDETTDTGKDEVVKAGDLRVTATAATDRKAIANGDSDLDTITLKTSEALTVNSITLERFGYSSADNVSVWLEDAYGNTIADAKEVSTSKDTVTLKIKKDYKEMAEGENNITTVVSLSGAAAGGTIGFKVTGVDSSAKNVDVADYKAYTYDIIAYSGSEVSISVKGNNKDYNYEEDSFYEVSRLKVAASNAAILVNGFTLTNIATWTDKAFDLDEFVKDVKVTVDGKEVSGLKFTANKDNELVVSFDDVEIAINKNAQFVTSIAMENFDDYGYVARLVLKSSGDFKAIEKKTGSRVSVKNGDTLETAENWKTYKFNGSKIKFTNTKLSSTIDAAQGSSDVVVAKGKVAIGEDIKIAGFTIVASTWNVIENMKLVIDGEEWDGKHNSDYSEFTFSNVEIENGGDVELVVDIFDKDETSGKTVSLTVKGAASSLNKAIFGTTSKYVDSKKYIDQSEVSGSISMSSVKIQPSKATLKNNTTKTAEFPVNETNRKTLFDGTYTAKKWDVYLNEFAIIFNSGATFASAISGYADDITFYLSIDGEEVGSADQDDVNSYTATPEDFSGYDTFSEVLVEAGKSVKIKIEAEASVEKKLDSKLDVNLYLRWDDKNGTEAGFAKAALTSFKFVEDSSVTVTDSSTAKKDTIVLEENTVSLAKFIVKPSNSNDDEITLGTIVLDFTGITNFDLDNITVKVDGSDLDNPSAANASWYYEFDGDSTEVDSDGVVIEVEATDIASNLSAPITTKVVSVNGKSFNREYSRVVVPALVTIAKQVNDGSETTYTVDLDVEDSQEVTDLVMYVGSDKVAEINGAVSDGQEFEAANQNTVKYIDKIEYKIDGTLITIEKSGKPASSTANNFKGYSDYFKDADNNTLRIYKAD